VDGGDLTEGERMPEVKREGERYLVHGEGDLCGAVGESGKEMLPVRVSK
jgi:hypothetical protein